MTTTYEWDIETCCLDVETGETDIIDHDHRDKISEWPTDRLLAALNEDTEPGGCFTRLVLVKDDAGGRSWAYVVDHKLPDVFEDGCRVPIRFRIELNPDDPALQSKEMAGDRLRAAREAAAERFMAIAAKYVPEGYTVAYRKSLSGNCSATHINAPKPVTRKALYIFLHECAHAHLHWPQRNKTRHVEEMEAEKWAHAKMRENGVPVPRAMTKRAKAYVRRKIRQAIMRGAKRIDPEAIRFAK